MNDFKITHPVVMGALFLLVLTGCTRSEPPAEPAPPFEIVTDVKQTMMWVLEPAADRIWDSAGFVITVEGEQDLAPVAEEAWLAVVSAAATLAESGNLLLLDGRSQGDDWNAFSKGLTEASKLALQAAQDKDAQALFDAGGRIYQVCLACHNQYWQDQE
jgi:hypothetical protein